MNDDLIYGLSEVSLYLSNIGKSEFAETLNKACAEIERLQPRWIPVSERLPKSMANKVLVWLEHDDLVGYIGYGHYEKYKGVETWYDLEHEEPFSKNGYMVTHWMPLPEPPKDGDVDG